jgi:hypothetical protein
MCTLENKHENRRETIKEEEEDQGNGRREREIVF